MPEGDSLRRAADRVRVLEGQVVSVETPHPRAALLGLADRLDGKRLERVEAIGKNLLLTFEGGLVLRSHLRMKGRWHVCRVEEALTGRAIYRRVGRPCRRCGEAIRSRPQGETARMAYWCPGCQAGTGMTSA